MAKATEIKKVSCFGGVSGNIDLPPAETREWARPYFSCCCRFCHIARASALRRSWWLSAPRGASRIRRRLSALHTRGGVEHLQTHAPNPGAGYEKEVTLPSDTPGEKPSRGTTSEWLLLYLLQ